MFSRAVRTLNVQPMLRLDYIASDANTEILSNQQSTLEDLGVSAAQWDPRQGPVTGNLGGADLVVCNCVPGSISNPDVLLENLTSATRDGGFVLLHTLLKGDTLGETVTFLTSLEDKSCLLSQVCSRLEAVVKAVVKRLFLRRIFKCIIRTFTLPFATLVCVGSRKTK